MPVLIDHNGPARVHEFLVAVSSSTGKTQTFDEINNDSETAFRGRVLKGALLTLPEDCKGLRVVVVVRAHDRVTNCATKGLFDNTKFRICFEGRRTRNKRHYCRSRVACCGKIRQICRLESRASAGAVEASQLAELDEALLDAHGAD